MMDWTVQCMKSKCSRIAAVIYMLFVSLLFGGCAKESTRIETVTKQETEEASETVLQEMFMSAEEDSSVLTVEEVFAESASYPELAEFLTAYYQIPDEYLAKTRYYYNYVDINDDGVQEIFAVVIGGYTEAKNGNPAVILSVDEMGTFMTLESFPSVKTPITISEHTTNGWHDIIYYAYGGDEEDGYRICRYNPNGGYKTELSEIVKELEPVGGVQILSNNLIDDMDHDRYLTLILQSEDMAE